MYFTEKYTVYLKMFRQSLLNIREIQGYVFADSVQSYIRGVISSATAGLNNQ
jgi:hypothetical protein